MTKREKDRHKKIQWSPLPLENYFRGRMGETKAGTEGQTKWWKLREFWKRWHISFICRKNACSSKQHAIQCRSASHFFFCSPRNCTGNHMAHKSCGHFFLSTKQHYCCMLSRGDTICIIFLRGSLEKSYDAKERRKETGTFHQSCPPLEDKANMY